MSDHLAIAGVSRTLRTLLRDRMRNAVPVTLAPPDVRVAAATDRRVNLYLFKVTENGHLKNQEIPGHGHPAQYGRPPLSLNLHYLLTTHVGTETAEDADLQCQSMLGDAMRVLHDYAVIPDSLAIIRPAVGTPGDPILDESLLDEFERIKVYLEPANLEEVSKIWTALPAANFRRSAVYEVSVVQIENRLARRVPQPVQTRRIFASTLKRPEVREVYRTPVAPADPLGDTRVQLNEDITIEGRRFLGDRVWVRLDGLEPIRVAPVTQGIVRIAVPDDEYPIDADHAATRPIPPADRLQPGPLTIQVITERTLESVEGGLDRGVTASHPREYRSNLGVLMLVPEITGTAPPSGNANTVLTVNGARLYDARYTTLVLVGDAAIEVRPPRPPDPAASPPFLGDPWAMPTPTSVQVPLTSLAQALPPPAPGGTPHAVRVQVNGAQNRADTFSFTLMP
jgi:hypothetical protein